MPPNIHPIGELPAINATDNPLNPLFSKAAIVDNLCGAVPVIASAPASPDNAPAITIDCIILRLTFIPANSAASLFNPTARNSYPLADLYSKIDTNTAIIIATIIPIFTSVFSKTSESHLCCERNSIPASEVFQLPSIVVKPDSLIGYVLVESG